MALAPFDTSGATPSADRSTDPGGPLCSVCEQQGGGFCSGLVGDDLRRLVSILSQSPVDPHVTLFREGDPALHLFAINSGAVKLYKLLPDGRRQVTAFLFAGDFFGYDQQGHYPYTAEALTPALLCRFPRRRLEQLFEDVPLLEKRLLAASFAGLATAQERMLLLGRKTAREKVASFLLELAGKRGAQSDGALAAAGGETDSSAVLSGAGGGLLLDVPMSRSDIADYLGLTIETVSRTLTLFKKEKLISLPSASQIALPDLEALERAADGGS